MNNPTLSYLYDVLIAFKAETCIDRRKWLITMAVRGIILYFICSYIDNILSWFPINRNETLSAALYDLFIPMPILLFLLWYIGTSILMFLAVVYYKPAAKNESEYAEIDKFLEWRDNQMKFLPYSEAQKLMQQTAVLNNLDRSNPEARKTLDYMNNKLRFMSYTESLDFLRGKQ